MSGRELRLERQARPDRGSLGATIRGSAILKAMTRFRWKKSLAGDKYGDKNAPCI